MLVIDVRSVTFFHIEKIHSIFNNSIKYFTKGARQSLNDSLEFKAEAPQEISKKD
jgi:hypothetical protein